ncbi:MAG: ABC transporter substrate-binding protein [Litorilinea sp.]
MPSSLKGLRIRLGAALILTLLLSAVLSACAPATVAPTPADGDTEAAADVPAADAPAAEGSSTLRIAIVGDESTLTPYTYITGYPGWNLLLLQYDTLMQLDLAGVPQPWLATNAEYSDDGLTVTLDLREDVTWHDGEPFTAEDVKFSVEYYKAHPRSRFTAALTPVASVETDGDYRVILTLANPAPSLELGTLSDVPMMPQHIWADVETPEEYAGEDANVGTGPYKLVDYTPDQFYIFEANADYFAGAPAVDELVAIKFADDAGTLAALRTNEVDMIVRPIGPEQIDLLAAQDGLAVAQGPLFTTQMLNYDMQRAPFNNLAVRQAISLGVDRQDIIDTVFLGYGTVGSPGWVHPVSPFYNPDVVASFDPVQAQAILDEAGIVDSDGDGVRELDGEPLAFGLIVNGSDSLRLRISELVAAMLADVGMAVEISAVESTTWEEAVWPGFDVNQGRNYDMAMWGWSAPVQADVVRSASLIHSDPAIGNLNLTGYVSEEADALGAALRTEVDADARAELAGELQTLIARDLPFVLLLYPDGAYAYNESVYADWAFMSGQGVFHKLSLLVPEARP